MPLKFARMFAGMGDSTTVSSEGDSARLEHEGLRIIRGLEPAEGALVLDCWGELWRGTVSSQRQLKTLNWERPEPGQVRWSIAPRRA